MKRKINVVSIALILIILAVAVLYYKERNIIDLIYLILLFGHFIGYVYHKES